VAKSKPSYECSACGAASLRWTGKCVKCGEFGTVAEVAHHHSAPGRRASTQGAAPITAAKPVSAVTAQGPVPASAPESVNSIECSAAVSSPVKYYSSAANPAPARAPCC
jgi:predicted ATP-dependent serine protease